MPSARILRTLDSGVMIADGRRSPRTSARRSRPISAACVGLKSSRPRAVLPRPQGHHSAHPKLPGTDGAPAPATLAISPPSAAGLTLEQVRNLKLKWAFGFDGDLTSFSQPAVLDGQVFVGSSAESSMRCAPRRAAFNGRFKAAARFARRLSSLQSARRHAVLFGDQAAWFYAVEAETGKLLWRKKVDEHPAARVTGSPAIYEGVVYIPVSSWEENFATQADYHCCTSRGSVVALRVRDGSQVWKSYTVTGAPNAASARPRRERNSGGPPASAVWSAPTVDPEASAFFTSRPAITTPSPPPILSDSVLAMDLATGRVVWSRQVTPRDIFSG